MLDFLPRWRDENLSTTDVVHLTSSVTLTCRKVIYDSDFFLVTYWYYPSGTAQSVKWKVVTLHPENFVFLVWVALIFLILSRTKLMLCAGWGVQCSLPTRISNFTISLCRRVSWVRSVDLRRQWFIVSSWKEVLGQFQYTRKEKCSTTTSISHFDRRRMSGVGTCRAKTLTGSGKGDKLDYGYSSPQKRTKSYLNCNESNEFPSNLSQNVRRKSGSLILEDGWIMGPLGLPVRETLEVGHRGTQKAFNQKSPSHQRTSERTESDNDPHHLHSQFPEQEHLSENNPDESSTAVYHRRRSVFDVEVTDEKKEQRAKQMQVNILQMLVLYPYYNLKSHSGIDDYSFTPVVHFFLPSTFSSFIHLFIYLFIHLFPSSLGSLIFSLYQLLHFVFIHFLSF